VSNQEKIPQIPWRVFVQMQRAADEYERVQIIASWAMCVAPEALDDMPAADVMRAFQQAMESLHLDPMMMQREGPAG